MIPAPCRCNKCLGKIKLKGRKVSFGSQFLRHTVHGHRPDCLRPMVRQNSMAEVDGRGTCLLHAGQAVRRGQRSQNPLEKCSYRPNFIYQGPPPKGIITSPNHHSMATKSCVYELWGHLKFNRRAGESMSKATMPFPSHNMAQSTSTVDTADTVT